MSICVIVTEIVEIGAVILDTTVEISDVVSVMYAVIVEKTVVGSRLRVEVSISVLYAVVRLRKVVGTVTEMTCVVGTITEVVSKMVRVDMEVSTGSVLVKVVEETIVLTGSVEN